MSPRSNVSLWKKWQVILNQSDRQEQKKSEIAGGKPKGWGFPYLFNGWSEGLTVRHCPHITELNRSSQAESEPPALAD